MDFQKALEERLEFYGNMLLEGVNEQKNIKTKRRNSSKESVTPKHQATNHGKAKTLTNDNQKKKLKRKLKNKHLAGIQAHLEKFEHTVSKRSVNDNPTDEASAVNECVEMNGASSPVEVVVYHNPSKRRKIRENPDTDQYTKEPETRFSMKQARHEVNKLGISGFVKTKRDEAQIALAVKLGAKPPKKEYMNYKVLQVKKKKERDDLEQTLTEARQHGLNLKNKKFKGKGKVDKIKKELGFVDGQVGTYRDGVQILSKSDIDKIKTSKVNSKFKKR